MIFRILCSLLLAGGLLAGCATKPKLGTEATPSRNSLPHLRRRLLSASATPLHRQLPRRKPGQAGQAQTNA